MAIINKTGITNGGTIQAEHVTRTIDALSGVSTDTIIATGSFTGSLTGTLTGTASFATTASFAVSASRSVSSSFATTASYALNAIGSGTEYVTLHLSSGPITGVAAGSTFYVGSQVTSSTADKVGVPIPVTGTIVSASVYLNTPTILNTSFQLVSLNLNGTDIISFNNLDPKTAKRDADITSTSNACNIGDWLDISIRPTLTATGLTFVAADILIKKS